MSTTFRVDGLKCNQCVATLTKLLAARFPNVDASIDLEQKLVSMATEVAPLEMKSVVEEAGFQFLGAE